MCDKMAADWAKFCVGHIHIHKTRTMYFVWWMKWQRIVIWRYGGDWKVSHGPRNIFRSFSKKRGKYGELVKITAAKRQRREGEFPNSATIKF